MPAYPDVKSPAAPPKEPSVFDSTRDKFLRFLTNAMGGYDPASSMMGVVSPLAMAAQMPARFAARQSEGLAGQAMGSLAETVAPGMRGLGVYDLKPEVTERVADLTNLGSRSSRANWAGEATQELQHGFGGDRNAARKWGQLWGAVSPSTRVPRSTEESVKVLQWHQTHPGEEMTKEIARSMGVTNTGSKVPNVNRAFRGEELSGDKVGAMGDFMTGENRLPIDVHALYGVGSHSPEYDPEIKALRALFTSTEGLKQSGGLTNSAIYKRYEDALRRTLEQIDSSKPGFETFGPFWEGSRIHKGHAVMPAPIDVLRKQGLLKYGAMLDPGELGAALKKSGWHDVAITGLLGAIAAEKAQGEAAPPSPSPKQGIHSLLTNRLAKEQVY